MNKALTPSHPATPQHNVPVTTPATADMAAGREQVSAQRTMKKKFCPGLTAATPQIAATLSSNVDDTRVLRKSKISMNSVGLIGRRSLDLTSVAKAMKL
jgi:hypothetical protein